MILLLAIRSLMAKPVRSAVLVGGFGLGVAVMAVLLGVGRVILDQAQAPALRGGGDVVIAGASGRLPNAEFVLSSVIRGDKFGPQVKTAAPSESADLYLVEPGGVTPILAHGGIPSLERALADPETARVSQWTDTSADRLWTNPDADDVLRRMDGFHPVPNAPKWSASWAEWLYFNGRTADARFYLTFMAGPLLPDGRRSLGVRLQLERGGSLTAYSDHADVSADDLLRTAPDLRVGATNVTLRGHDYDVALDLPAESGHGRVRGEFVLRADPGRSLPPLVMRGQNGWVSGYVVPVTSGTLSGSLSVENATLSLDGGAGYHDHNWGFWQGVSWQWGQVEHAGLSIVYGRVHPPPDAADASRLPGFVVVLGPDGPLGFASDVTIDETDATNSGRPSAIAVRGRGPSLTLAMDLTIRQTTATTMTPQSFGGGLDFLQLRADFRVSGQAGQTALDFSGLGSAETFRGRTAQLRTPAQ